MSLECISRFCYYLAKRIKVIYSMICSSLFPSVPLNARESKIGCISCVASMLLLLCYLSPFRRIFAGNSFSLAVSTSESLMHAT